MTSKKIYVLFTRYPGRDAKLLMWRTKFPYTHTSVGLEEDMDTFYTFISKGFLVEKVTKYEKPDRPSFPCALYDSEFFFVKSFADFSNRSCLTGPRRSPNKCYNQCKTCVPGWQVSVHRPYASFPQELACMHTSSLFSPFLKYYFCLSL